MFWFWLIFTLFSISLLFSSKNDVTKAVIFWETDDPNKLTKVFQRINLCVSIFLTLIGILGLFGYLSP